MSHPSISQKNGKFSLCDHATGLRLLSFSVYTHYWEVTYKVFAWKILEKLQRTEGTHGVLQIQLGLGILSQDGPKSYNQAKIQIFLFEQVSCERTDWPQCFAQRMPMDCFWGHPHQDVFLGSSSTQQQRAQRSPTLPRVMHHRPVFSTRISDPHFLPQCMVFTQFFIYIRHCWGRFLLLSLNTQGSSLIPALKRWGSQSWKSIQEVPFAGFVTSD